MLWWDTKVTNDIAGDCRDCENKLARLSMNSGMVTPEWLLACIPCVSASHYYNYAEKN
jgi:hypothetical protein